MANTLITKNSSTASNVPAVGELVEGELAINTADKKLYSKTASAVFQVFDGVYATAAHVHSTFDRPVSVLANAAVFSNITVLDGIVTAIATRNLLVTDIGAAPLASPSFTGTVTLPTTEMADNILRRPYIDDYALFRTTLTATATTTLNYSTAQVYVITMSVNITTLSVSNEPATGRYGEMTLKLVYNSATARTIDWTDIGVKWGTPGAPTLTSVSGKHDVIHLWTDDAGASWYGSYILNY